MRVDLTSYGAQTLRALRRLPSKRHLKRERHVVTETQTLTTSPESIFAARRSCKQGAPRYRKSKHVKTILIKNRKQKQVLQDATPMRIRDLCDRLQLMEHNCSTVARPQTNRTGVKSARNLFVRSSCFCVARLAP